VTTARRPSRSILFIPPFPSLALRASWHAQQAAATGARGTTPCTPRFDGHEPRRRPEETTMRGILLWLIGIPIPVIILLYLFNVI
jgi:hypothetical protein